MDPEYGTGQCTIMGTLRSLIMLARTLGSSARNASSSRFLKARSCFRSTVKSTCRSCLRTFPGTSSDARPVEGFRDRCSLHYHKIREQRSEEIRSRQSYRVQIGDLRNWDIVVAKCQHCRNVAEVPLKIPRAMAGNDTVLDDVIPRLRCQRCKRRGEAFLTIGKQPR